MKPHHEPTPSPPAAGPGSGPPPAPAPATLPVPLPAGEAAGIPPLDIAALDDDADFREYLRAVLEPAGHQLRTFDSADGLVESIAVRLPDVVLLDMKMGKDTGEDVLARLRERWPKLCVIVVTGYPTLDSMREIFKQDAFDYLAKPFAVEALHRVLQQAAQAFGLGQRPQDRLRLGLGLHIRLARTGRGWTLKDLSESSGVSVSQLSAVERGAHLPSLESLLAIATAMDQRPSEWLAEAGF